ncbi:MAG: hypothetical protein ACP5N3_02390 [Candidatus Nanoarchaeia archaeon]
MNTDDSQKARMTKVIDLAETINFKFIKFTKNVELFFNQIRDIHQLNLDLSPKEQNMLNESVAALKTYLSTDESTMTALLSDSKLKTDLDDVKAIIRQIIKHSQEKDFIDLANDAKQLERELLDLQNRLEKDRKLMAA